MKPEIEGGTSISELVEARIFLIITEPVVIAELSEHLNPSTLFIKQVYLSKNIVSSSEKLGKVQDHVEKFSSSVAGISKAIDTQAHNQQPKWRSNRDDKRHQVRKNVDTKVQAWFTEAVGSY